MDIVKGTDPSTVTQHGLYMRPLAHNPLFENQPQTPPQSGPKSDATQPPTPQTQSPELKSQTLSSESQSRTQGLSEDPSKQNVPWWPKKRDRDSDEEELQAKAGGQQDQPMFQQVPSQASDAHQTPGEARQEEGWGRERVTLLGDAAHATIPNG